MNDNIRVQFEVSKEKLPTILGLLMGEVSNIATKSMADILAARAAKNTPAAPVQARPVAQPAPPAMRGQAPISIALLQRLVSQGFKAGDMVSYKQIMSALEASGFSPTSCSPAIYGLVLMGIAKRSGKRNDHRVQLIKTDIS